MSHDYGNEQYAKEQSKKYMNVYKFLRFLEIADNNEAEYVFENDDNEKIKLKLKAFKNSDINYVSSDIKGFKTNEKPQGESDFYWYKLFPEDDILFLKFNKCLSNTIYGLNDKQKQQFPNIYEFERKLVSKINNSYFSKLVVDLRENPGGKFDIVEIMLTMLKHRVNLEGKDISVITGKRTSSASVEFANKLQNQLDATLVGEETGGNINLFSTDNEIITLPNSKLYIVKSSSFRNSKDGYIGGVKPDIEINQTYKNYVNGIDDCYEYILHK